MSGPSDMDDAAGILRGLGRLEGRLVSLEEANREERHRVRIDHEKLMSKIDVMEDRLVEALGKNDSMQSQIYSNKQMIEAVAADVLRLKEDIASFKMLHARGIGALSVLSVVAGLLISAVFWLVSHFSDVAKALFPGKG